LDRRLGGPQSQSGCGGEEINSHPLLGLQPPIIQSIAQEYTTALSQLLVRKHIILKFIQSQKAENTLPHELWQSV
jgi:hypothetical protein